MGEGLAQSPYAVARGGIEPTTLRLQGKKEGWRGVEVDGGCERGQIVAHLSNLF
jgi:hypothetical protein